MVAPQWMLACLALPLAACSNRVPTEPTSEPAPAPEKTPAPVPRPVGDAQPIPVRIDASTAPTAADIGIVDRPIRFGNERERLTIEYRRAHQDPTIDTVTIEPRVIILHYTAGGSADGTWNYFNKPRIGSGRKKLQRAAAVNVSAHFLVDRDGTIFRLMPETTMARHCIGMNHVSIGVENVGDNDRFPLTDAQVDANERLVRYLVGAFPITHLIGHSEYRAMEGHAYFLELDPRYRNRKPDPGDAFMSRVRKRVADLSLAGPPR